MDIACAHCGGKRSVFAWRHVCFFAIAYWVGLDKTADALSLELCQIKVGWSTQTS